MREIINDSNLVACCGLYCGVCKKYREEKCPGCKENNKAGWCKTRTCCIDNKYSSCADCKTYLNINECKNYDNIIAKFFSFIFRSDRKACIDRVREIGAEAYAKEMAEKKIMAIKKK